MRRAPALIAIAFLMAPAVARSGDVLASSTFDTGDEGWQVYDIEFVGPYAQDYTSPLSILTPDYNSTGGVPGGYISQQDPSEEVFYFCAPAPFLGDQSAAYGGRLVFDLNLSSSGVIYQDADLILAGNGLVLLRQPLFSIGTGWNRYAVPLVESLDWSKTSLGGATPTQAEFQSALSSLTQLCVRGEYINTVSETASLDNVALRTAEDVPALPGAGLVAIAVLLLVASALLRRSSSAPTAVVR